MDGTFLLPETDLLTPPPLPPSVVQLGVTGVPPVERSVAMQVCPYTVSTRQGKLCLLFWACRYSSGLILRGSCGLWRCCLHLTLRRYCRFFRLKALRDVHGGGHNPEVLKELRTAPDLAPRATKVMARSLGMAKQHAVGPSHSSLPPNLHPVVRPFVPSVRSAPGTGLQARCGLHGCLRQGLGGHVQRACCVGGLDGSPTALAYQLPRVAGSTPGLEPSQETLTRRAHTGPYRQHCDRRMSQLARHLLLWSRKHLRSLRAIHIPGVFNRTADELSRAALPGEWRLHPQTVQLIWRHFRLAQVDLFMSLKMSHCQLFYSLTEGTLGTDALAHSWPRVLRKYAFPPVSLLAQTLCKIREEEEQILLVAPYWPTRTWFPELMLLLTAPPWQIPLRKDLLTPCGTRVQTSGNFMTGPWIGRRVSR